MTDELKLSLDRGGKDRKGQGGLHIVLALILVSTVAVLTLLVMDRTGAGPDRGGLSADKLETLALKLERQQLYGAAARAWTEYIGKSSPGDGEAAAVWFRTGKLYQEGGDYERALDAYYRSESHQRSSELESEISLRVTECLERLGRFAALRSELENRTSLDPDAPTPGEEIVAEVGAWKISRTDLEKMIESEIDAQLSSIAGNMTPEQLVVQKEKVLKDVLATDQQLQILERMVAEELIYMNAMEEKIYETDGYRDIARNFEKKLMIQKLLDREYARSIRISDQEVREYYEAHKGDFTRDGAQLSFEEAGAQAYAAVNGQKQMELQSQLIEFLKDKYDVVIHRALFGAEDAGE